jgi:signal transduction histidine kinase
VRKFWRQLLPEYLFTWPAFIATFLWALLIHFTDLILNQSGNFIPRFVVILGLHTLVYCLLYLSTRLFLNRITHRFVPAALFLTICFMGLGRGYLFDIWLYSWDIAETLNIGFRMRASLLNTAVSFVIVTIAIANTRRHQMAIGQLFRERSRLERTDLVASEEIKQFHETLVQSISSDLTRRIDEMKGKSAQQVLILLHDLINKVVQPLSRELSTRSQPWTPDFGNLHRIGIKWGALLVRSFNPGKVNYLLIPILLTIIAFPTALLNSSLAEVFLGLGLVNVTAALVGFVFRRIYLKRRGRVIEYFVALLVTGTSMGLASTYLTREYDERFSFVFPGILFYLISATLLSLINGAEDQRRLSEDELRLTVEQLEWKVARVRETQRQNYRQLSRNLHDGIQAQLSSKYLQLERAIASGDASDEILQQMFRDLSSLMQVLDARQANVQPIDAVVERVRGNWSTIAVISFNSDPVTLKAIERDPLCSTSIIDVIPELVFNGIKHGKATEIDLQLNLIHEQKVQLSVIDNGSFEKVESAIGLGTSILNESCISWSRERSNAQTITVADFALSPSA